MGAKSHNLCPPAPDTGKQSSGSVERDEDADVKCCETMARISTHALAKAQYARIAARLRAQSDSAEPEAWLVEYDFDSNGRWIPRDVHLKEPTWQHPVVRFVPLYRRHPVVEPARVQQDAELRERIEALELDEGASSKTERLAALIYNIAIRNVLSLLRTQEGKE